MRNLMKKLNDFLTMKEEPIPHFHKICPECEGMGYEDIFTVCKLCLAEGTVKKTYQEYVDTLPPLSK